MAYDRLVRLLPLAVIVHVSEEYLTHFPRYVGEVTGNPMPVSGFLFNNLIFWLVLVGLTVWTIRAKTPLSTFLLLAWAAGNLFWNFVFHLTLVELYDRNSPGLISACMVYLPLSIGLWSAALRERLVGPGALIGAIALGAPVMGLVIVAGLPR
jgi:hypothetical protein